MLSWLEDVNGFCKPCDPSSSTSFKLYAHRVMDLDHMALDLKEGTKSREDKYLQNQRSQSDRSICFNELEDGKCGIICTGNLTSFDALSTLNPLSLFCPKSQNATILTPTSTYTVSRRCSFCTIIWKVTTNVTEKLQAFIHSIHVCIVSFRYSDLGQ